MKKTKKKVTKKTKKVEPREYTIDEVRESFIKAALMIVDYWAHVPSESNMHSDVSDAEWRCAGAAFGILAMLDGEHGFMPAFTVIPYPHPDDKEYFRKQGMNWYPDTGDIAGGLHDEFAKYR
jgi:hypothetical protein